MRCDASARLALLKLITGGLRVGVSARLAKIALAEIGGVDGRRCRGGVARPRAAVSGAVRLAGEARAAAGPGAGAGVPSADAGASAGGRRTSPRCSPRTGAPNGNGTASACSSSRPKAAGGSIRAAPRTFPARFPEILEAMDFHAVLDGELLVMRDGQVAPFADLQQRLNRKVVSAQHDGGLPGRHPALRPAVRGGRGRAPAAVRCAARAAGGLVCAHAAGADGSVGADPVRLARRADGAARRRAGRLDRGADAEARRRRLCAGSGEGAVVEVEARSADASTRC